ncbi:MAG: DUF3408 domain-containing protein [Rikenellaceae bacterium]
MNNRERPDIDEGAMQDMVARGTGQTPTPTPTDEPQKSEVRKRQPRDKSSEYVDRYLNKIEFPARQLIYVSKKTHASLTKIVQIVGGDRSNLSSYVENIICSHLESNKDLVNGLYANNFTPPVE